MAALRSLRAPFLQRSAPNLQRYFGAAAAAPSLSAIKELRELSGAPIVDCKKALAEGGGDMDAAWEWLRKRGAAVGQKVASREAKEGLVGVISSGNTGAIVELNSETDFAARNENFQQLLTSLCGSALQQPDGAIDMDAFSSSPTGVGSTVTDAMTELTGKMRENLKLRRAHRVAVDQGTVASYVHGAVAAGMGRMGAIVALDATGDQGPIEVLGKQIAMHVVAARPAYLSRDLVPAHVTEREKRILAESVPAGKPENVIEKIVEGKLNKFYKETVLLEQQFMLSEDKISVQDAVDAAAKEFGAPIKVSDFVRFECGEELEQVDGHEGEEAA